jgi:hypothetical protein
LSAANRDESLHDLTSAQLAAINALIVGGSHEEAAQAAGVHRVTVTRWVNHHPAFVAQMNQAKLDVANQAVVKIGRLTDLALDVVHAALEEGDRGVALKWLNLVPPVPKPEYPDPTDPRDVIERVRARMPSALLVALTDGDERTTEEAEAEIKRRLS